MNNGTGLTVLHLCSKVVMVIKSISIMMNCSLTWWCLTMIKLTIGINATVLGVRWFRKMEQYPLSFPYRKDGPISVWYYNDGRKTFPRY